MEFYIWCAGHMTSHIGMGIKAFVCPTCGQGLIRKENLRAHMFM